MSIMANPDIDSTAMLTDEINELEAEIEELQAKLNAKEHLAVSCQSLSQIMNAKSYTVDSEDKVTESFISRLNDELQILKKLTDVDLIDVTGFPLDGAEPNSFKKMRYTVKGSSYGVTFQLNFKLSQLETEIRIDHLEIDSINPVNIDLGHFFDNLESECWLQGFIQVFVPYAKMRSQRRRTFQSIQEKFGNLVQLPAGISGSVIEFSHHLMKEQRFLIRWDFNLSSPHHMSHNVKLVVDVLPSAMKGKAAAMRSKILKQASEMFDKMVESLGPETAVESFIRSSVIDDMETTE